MAYVYECSVCKRGEADGITRDDLVVKKVLFLTMGAGANTIASRVTGWLCEPCLFADEDWNREPHQRQRKPAKKSQEVGVNAAEE